MQTCVQVTPASDAQASARLWYVKREGLGWVMGTAMARWKWELIRMEGMERLAQFRHQLAERVDPAQLRSALESMVALPLPQPCLLSEGRCHSL